MIKRIVTFNIGGPMRGYYIALEAENEINIRHFCIEHWPKDWVTLYDPEVLPQLKKFNLKQLCVGEIEFCNGKLFFNERGVI